MGESLLPRCLLAVSLAASLAACGSEAGLGVDAGPEAQGDGSIDSDAGVELSLPVRYPVDRTQSPITAHLAARLRDAADSDRNEAVFAKVGDSITVSTGFMHCFAGNPDSITPSVDETVAAIAAGESFDRTSLSAGVGWSAGMVLAGSPSALTQEIAALNPSMAVVMYGTNDAESGNLDVYGGNLLTIVDELLAAGVVPIVSTIPPRDYNANDARVPFYNDMARAVAEARQVPLVDFYREAALLPGYGLGGDGLHPRAIGGGCDFSESGLAAGYNTRNRVTIEALDRLRRVLSGDADGWDEGTAGWEGSGSKADPFVVDVSSLPFTHSGDTRDSSERHIDVYSGCSEANESGAERWYRLDTAAAADIRINLADRGDVDLDLHVLSGGSEAANCTARNDRSVDVALSAGTHYLVVDTYVSGGVEKAGEYVLSIRAL